MVKKQFIKTSEGSKMLAIIGAILQAVEEVSEELGVPPEEVVVSENILEPVDLSRGMVTAYYSVVGVSLGDLPVVEKRISIAGGNVKLALEPKKHIEGLPSGVLYEEAPRAVLFRDSSLWKQLAHDTTRTGIEYMGIYLGNGEVLVVEGERFHVRVPFVRSLASIHTHPDPYCAMSVRDIESGLDLLVEGGLFEAVATQSCASVMYRVGFVSENDYVSAREFVVSKGRKPEKLLRLSTIRFSRMAY